VLNYWQFNLKLKKSLEEYFVKFDTETDKLRSVEESDIYGRLLYSIHVDEGDTTCLGAFRIVRNAQQCNLYKKLITSSWCEEANCKREGKPWNLVKSSFSDKTTQLNGVTSINRKCHMGMGRSCFSAWWPRLSFNFLPFLRVKDRLKVEFNKFCPFHSYHSLSRAIKLSSLRWSEVIIGQDFSTLCKINRAASDFTDSFWGRSESLGLFLTLAMQEPDISQVPPSRSIHSKSEHQLHFIYIVDLNKCGHAVIC